MPDARPSPAAVAALRRTITAGRSQEQVTAAVAKLVAEATPGLVARTYLEAAGDLDPEVLGYVAFPPLREHLRRDPGLRRAFLDLVSRRRGSQLFRIVLLDFIDDAIRHGGDPAEAQPALLDIALASRHGPKVRARAARSLIRMRDAQTTTMFERLLHERGPLVVDVAAHALVERQRRWRIQSDLSPVVAFARAHPRQALRSSGVMRALAASGTPAARTAVRALARAARRPEEVVRVATIAAPRLDAASRAALTATDGVAGPVLEAARIEAPPAPPASIRMPDGKQYSPAQLRRAIDRAIR